MFAYNIKQKESWYIMGLIKKILNLLNESVIYYELDGDDHTYSVNMLSYIFKRNEFLIKDKKRFIVKDNVRYIHFRNFLINGIIDAPSTASVRITDKFDNFGNIHVYSKDFVQLNFNDDSDNLLFSVTSEKAKDVSYSSYIKEARIVDAELVDVCGSSCSLEKLSIKSERLNYSVSSNNIKIINYEGTDLNLSNSRGIIKNVCLSDVEHLAIKKCSLESENGYFNVSNTPRVKSSVWLFSKPLTYNNGTIGKKDEGFVLDDKTFSKEECFDLGRSYVSYALSKVLEKVYDDNEDLADAYYRKVAKQLDDLEREYDSKVELLEESRDVFEEGLQNVKLKRYVVDKKKN